MFTIPGVLALLFFLFIRPQEAFPALQHIPLLYVFFGLSLFGLALDLRLGRLVPSLSPQLPWVFALFVWTLLTLVVGAPATFMEGAIELVILFSVFFVLSQGVQSFRALERVALTLVVLALFLAAVGIHQGTAELGCAQLDLSNPRDLSVGIPDGRPCRTAPDCQLGPDAEPGAEYICERIGLLGTTSIGKGRVRYRGVLQDPNELALTLGCALALCAAFAGRRRSRLGLVFLVAAIVATAICVIFTKSRTGQVVFLAVMGAYFFRRVGKRGLILAALLALPLLLLGGRGGSEADESANLRLEAWYEGLQILRSRPIFGVGFNQFPEYHEITAHNSYLLAAVELGLPGMLLWSAILYISVKIPMTGLRRFSGVEGAQVARDWGMALLAALGGLLVGIVFLSMSFHPVLWIYLALTGGYYAAARAHDPGFRVRFGLRDLVLVFALDLGFLVLLTLYLRVKGV